MGVIIRNDDFHYHHLCGKKDNAKRRDNLLTLIILFRETTTTDEGYTIINGFYRIKSNNGDKDTILYIPYRKISNKVFYLEELHKNRRQKGGLTLKR